MEPKVKTDSGGKRNNTIYRFLIPAAIALLLELFVFQFRSIQSLFLTEQEYPLEQLEMEEVMREGNIFRLTGEEPMIYLSGLQERCGTQKLRNIRIEFSLPFSEDVPYIESKVLRIRPYVSDAGREFFTQLADHICREDIPQSSFLWLNGIGAIKTAGLRPFLSNGDAIRIQKIVLNAHRPLAISPLRVLVFFLFLLAGGALRRKDTFLYRTVEQLDPRTEVVMLFLMALILLGPACYLIGQNEYLRDQVHFNPYHKLAERLAVGEVTLAEEPPAWLKEMENPYDDTLRTVLEEESEESFLWDYAYYKGHYYVYFGIVPCILFYLPFYLLTGAHVSNAAVVMFTAF
nr:hypothetical protein [Lachnospiraceae bacterium]